MTELENGSGRQSTFKALSKPPRIKRVLSSRYTGYALLLAIGFGGEVLSKRNPLIDLSPQAIEYQNNKAHLDSIKRQKYNINDKVDRGRISELMVEAEKLEAKIENTPLDIIGETRTTIINDLLYLTGKMATYLSLFSIGVIFGRESPSTSSTGSK